MSTSPIVWKPPNNFSLTNWVEFVTVNTILVGNPRNQFNMIKNPAPSTLIHETVIIYGIRRDNYTPYVVLEIESSGEEGVKEIETKEINWHTYISSKTTYIFIKKGLVISPSRLYQIYFLRYGSAQFTIQMPSRGCTFR
jgi:hypothetical protein